MADSRFGAVVLSIVGCTLISASAFATTFPYTLQGPSAGVSNSGTYLIALPATTSAPTAIVTCVDLKTVIDGGGTGVASVIQRYDRATDSLVECACPTPNCFPIDPGEAYQVQVSASTTFTINGADAFVMIPLRAAGTNSLSGINFVALPFATTLGDAEALMRSIDFATTLNVQRYLTLSDSYQVYTGRKGGGTAFALSDGEGYVAKVSATRYWAAPGPGFGCLGQGGTFASGLTAAGMAAAFCNNWTDINYHCVAGVTSVTLTNLDSSSTCFNGTITLTFTVPGGITAAAHPYGYSICCNSPQSNSMGTDGNPLVNINNTTQAFGEFSVTSAVHDAQAASVPAVGWVGMIIMALGLLGVGIYSRLR